MVVHAILMERALLLMMEPGIVGGGVINAIEVGSLSKLQKMEVDLISEGRLPLKTYDEIR